MATWHGTVTDEEEEVQESLWSKLWGRITGFWGFFVKVLIFLFLVWLFFSGMALLSDEHAIPEKDASYSSISQEDSDAAITQKDVDLYNFLMPIVRKMNYGDFILKKEEAEEFGNSYFQESETVYVTEVAFRHEQKIVDINYDLGVNKKVRLTFNDHQIRKEMIRYAGFSEGGSFFRYLKWYTYGKFAKGYPKYTCTISMDENRTIGGFNNQKTEKVMIRQIPFSKFLRLYNGVRRILGNPET